jgi:hypothetical protein
MDSVVVAVTAWIRRLASVHFILVCQELKMPCVSCPAACAQVVEDAIGSPTTSMMNGS